MLLLASALVNAHAEPEAVHRQRLIHLVRQDCGSCHGLTLQGGLGPALAPQRMQSLPMETIVATILHGRPGTPMPPFRGILDDSDARWIAHQLQSGFPQED